MIKLSVSTLQACLDFGNGLFDEAELIARIRRTGAQTAPMHVGIALDDMFCQEVARYQGLPVPKSEDTGTRVFGLEKALPLMEQYLGFAGWQTQLPVSKTYTLHTGEEVVLSGRIDALLGSEVVDVKTSGKPAYMCEYEDSYQWRCYLDMLGLPHFRYAHFCCQYGAKQATHKPSWIIEVRDVQYEELRFVSYPEMGGDIAEALNTAAPMVREIRGW